MLPAASRGAGASASAESPGANETERDDPTGGIAPSAASAPRSSPRPWWPILALASACLLVLAFPPYDLGWIGWIAPAPLFGALLAARSPREALLASLATGAVFFLGFYGWVRQFALEAYLACAVGSGGYYAVCLAVAWLAMRKAPPALRPATLAAGWVLAEWLRSVGPLAFSWATLASSQHRALPVLQLLDLTGSYGLSFLMALVSASLAAVCCRQPRAAVSLAVALGLVGVATARGAWVLGAAPGIPPHPRPLSTPTAGRDSTATSTQVERGGSHPAGEARVGNEAIGTESPSTSTGPLLHHSNTPLLRSGTTLPVAVIQASRAGPNQGSAVHNEAPLEEYVARTREAVAEGARVVVWPEAALPARVSRWAGLRAELAALLPPGGALVGGVFEDHPSGAGATNSAVALDAAGQVTGRYDKIQLVPFGEYVPFRPLFPWADLYGSPEANLVSGTETRALPAGGERVGVSICVESAFSQYAREFTLDGASLLAVITSDGWTGRTDAALQHAAMAPLRAIENRRSLARAAATGISALIDPYGRTLASLPLFRQGYLLADVPLRRDRTLYTRLGDWPVLLSIVWLLFLLRRTVGDNRRAE